MVSEQLPGGEVLSRTTDAFGRPAGISVAGIGDPGSPDYAVTCGYDTAGRFGSVTTLAPLAALAVQYGYVQGSDLMAGWSSNVGVSFQRTFEPNRDLIASVTNAWNGAAVSRFAYTNDELGRRAARVDSGLTQNSFGYNIRSEVIEAIMGSNTYGYEYDPIGNRLASTNNATTVSYAANLLNQYTNVASAVSITPTYDDDGNMTAYGDWGFAWNGENRLIAATNATEAVSYAYDYQGRMIEKTTDSPTTRYLWDGFNTIAETNANGTRRNVWGLDLSQTQQGAGGVGGLLAVSVAGGADPGIFYPAYDANGNITEYVDATGDVAASRTYSPFGETTAATGNADAFSHWWSTKPWDPVTGFSEYEFRMYNPELGRWLSRDPVDVDGGPNLYAYVLNNPISLVDGDGLFPIGIGIGLGGGAIGVGGYFYEQFFAPYSDQRTEGGTRLIYIKDECTIVVLIAHGRARGSTLSEQQKQDVQRGKPGVLLADHQVEPHLFFFEGKCQAGGVVSCWAATSNKLIPEKNRIDGLNVDSDKNVSLALGVSLFHETKEWWRSGYWVQKAEAGAKTKAEEICSREKCCCKDVTVYFEYGGIGQGIISLPGRPYRKKKFPCKRD